MWVQLLSFVIVGAVPGITVLVFRVIYKYLDQILNMFLGFAIPLFVLVYFMLNGFRQKFALRFQPVGLPEQASANPSIQIVD